ncbi:MAG: hypothetical protein M3380_16795, partial [Chloroflexota bacterium]|nr:hypothetical protein [Chloroflexota bacterium]
MANGPSRLPGLLLLLLFLAGCAGPFEGPAQAPAAVAPPSPTHPPPATPTSVPPTPSAVVVRAVPATPTPDPDVRRFPETGHSIRGAFRRFWEERGGIAAFGLPLTEALPVDGATVQYFERARFESRDGSSVVLGRVVAEALLGRRAPITPAVPKAGCQFFAETRHNLCEPLLQFWKSAGGVALLGYPLEEAEHADGILVQHFERARLEMPEGKPAQLGRVGAEALERMAGGTLLRVSEPGPASQRAMVIGQTAAARPLGQVTIRIRVEGYTGPAEIVVADRHGPTGRYAMAVRSGAAEARVAALG